MKAATVALVLLLALPAAASAQTAPGGPGATAVWTEADKDGYGTSVGTASKVWHTLDDGRLTEVFYPDLATPSVRTLDFVVSDGKTFVQRDNAARNRTIQLLDSRSLTYQQVNEEPGRFRVTKTYVTDPARNVLQVEVRFESLTGKKLDLYALFDPSLGNDGMDDSGSSSGDALLATDAGSPLASALVGSPVFVRTSSGYLGTSSDGWQDLQDRQLDATYSSAPNGNVVQTAQTSLTGLAGNQQLTVALGFGGDAGGALTAARATLASGFGSTRAAYEAGWHGYLGGLSGVPSSASGQSTLYNVSVMTLAAHEDKTHRGGYIASPTMPWVWGTGLENPSGAYHLVWSRDLYQIATALIAAGDTAGANRAVDYLFGTQQKPDGSFPQNSTVDGTPHWGNLQLDEVALPIVLAWQLGRNDSTLYRDHIKKAADFLVNFPNAPFTPQERWENQSGFSPGTIASEIAGLVCAADIARRNGDSTSAALYEKTADDWQKRVQGWTATTNGPYSTRPYYLRLTKDGRPNSGTTYNIGDSGPTVDQQGRRSQLPGARAARRQAGERPGRAQHRQGRGRAAGLGRCERPVLLASLQLRRLWREEGRQPLGHRLPGQSDRGLVEQRDNRAQLADLRRRARRVRAADGEPDGSARPPGQHGRRRERRADAAGAGVGARLSTRRRRRLPGR